MWVGVDVDGLAGVGGCGCMWVGVDVCESGRICLYISIFSGYCHPNPPNQETWTILSLTADLL